MIDIQTRPTFLTFEAATSSRREVSVGVTLTSTVPLGRVGGVVVESTETLELDKEAATLALN